MRLLALMSVLMYIVAAEIASGVANGGWDTVGSGDGHFSLNFGVAIDSATQIMSPGTESANSAMSSQTALVSDGEHHTWDATSNAQPIITSLPQAFGSSLTTSAACSTTSNLANWGTAYSYGTMYGTSAGSVSAASTGGFLSGGGNTSSWTLPKGPMTLAPKASSASQDVSTQSRRPTLPSEAFTQGQNTQRSNSSAVAQSSAPLGYHQHISWYSVFVFSVMILA